MAKIITLADRRYDPHMTGAAECLACGHAWTARGPVGVDELECPACRLATGVWSALCRRDGMEWRCNCFNSFFRIAPEGIYCPVCGEWQREFEV